MLEVNLRNRAISQTMKAYNSMCRFNGKDLGATNQGLFQIGGYEDNTAPIQALVKSGQLDMGVHNKKRFRFFYFGVDTSGYLKLSVFGDGELAGEYEVHESQGLQYIRVPISRSVQARYWQWVIENKDGAFFALYSVKALPVMLHPGLR